MTVIRVFRDSCHRLVLTTACTLLALQGAALAAPQGQASTDSRHLVDLAIEAMGGLETLRGLHAVRLEGFEFQNMLEQSERPEGPYLVIASSFEEIRDLAGDRLWRSTTRRSIVHPPDGATSELVVADGIAANRFGERLFPGSSGDLELARDELALGPGRVLLEARAAEDLRGTGTTQLQGVEHDIVAFTWAGRAVAVYLNRHTGLPTAVERERVFDDAFWGIWGDLRARVEYGMWTLEPGGLMYPRQWTESRGGMPYVDRTIVALELNPDFDEGRFALDPGLREQMEARDAMGPDRVALGMDFRGGPHEAVELAAGIVQLPGMWNVGLIEQDSGIVVLEAPISSRYSEQVIAEVERRFPDRPITALVTTSDAWPHVGGVREYVAHSVPIHAFGLNHQLLQRIIDAPRTRRPDRLAGFRQAEPQLLAVGDGDVLGDGPNRAVLYPLRGEGGERMVAVWFPEHRLLYSSDLIQPGPGGDFFMPSYLADVEALVEREGLEPETVFGMHLGSTPWSEVTAALAAVRRGEGQ